MTVFCSCVSFVKESGEGFHRENEQIRGQGIPSS